MNMHVYTLVYEFHIIHYLKLNNFIGRFLLLEGEEEPYLAKYQVQGKLMGQKAYHYYH